MSAGSQDIKSASRARQHLARVAVLLLAALPPQFARADAATAGMEAYRRGDYTTALAKLKHVAERGHGPACVIVGRIYLDGQGVAKDASLAAHYFERGSIQGDPLAASYLGDLYSAGNGVAKNGELAIRYWRLAGHLGEPLAAHNLGVELWHGIDVPANKPLAFRWLEAAVGDLGASTEHLRAGFLADRDTLRAELGTEGLAAAAALVTPDGPTAGVVFRDGERVFDRAMERFARARGASGVSSPAVVVMLVLVKPNGSIGDSIVENGSDYKGFEAAVLRLVRASPIVPARVGNEPVASWQVLKWTLRFK